jgi:hypothetical protein
MITIAYLTNRRNPQIEWFFDSLHNECGGNYDGIKILVIDYWAQEDGRDWSAKAVKARRDVFKKGRALRDPAHPAEALSLAGSTSVGEDQLLRGVEHTQHCAVSC